MGLEPCIVTDCDTPHTILLGVASPRTPLCTKHAIDAGKRVLDRLMLKEVFGLPVEVEPEGD